MPREDLKYRRGLGQDLKSKSGPGEDLKSRRGSRENQNWSWRAKRCCVAHSRTPGLGSKVSPRHSQAGLGRGAQTQPPRTKVMPPSSYVTTHTGWLDNKLAPATTLSRATWISKSCGLEPGRQIEALVWEVEASRVFHCPGGERKIEH